MQGLYIKLPPKADNSFIFSSHYTTHRITKNDISILKGGMYGKPVI